WCGLGGGRRCRVGCVPCRVWRRWRGGGNSRRTCFPSPHQHSPVLVQREMVDLYQFLFEDFERRRIEMKLEREGAVGHAPATLEHGRRLVQDLLKGHE